jgi:hypothetical protein
MTAAKNSQRGDMRISEFPRTENQRKKSSG